MIIIVKRKYLHASALEEEKCLLIQQSVSRVLMGYCVPAAPEWVLLVNFLCSDEWMNENAFVFCSGKLSN